jgi:LacI family transcriptional regulator
MWSDVGLAARRSYDGRCDGLIIVAPQPGGEIVEALQKRGIPLVIVGTTAWLPGVSSVDIDNRQVGEAAARHLVSLGHRTIAFCDHEPEQVSGIERHAGFVAAARAVGLSDEDVLYVGVPIPEADPHYGAVAWDRLLGQARRPTGILCWNDGLALALLRSAAGKGIKVPEDISIIGVDDIPDGETSSPALTTFRNPLSEIGRAATTLLIELLGEQSDRSEIVRFPSELVVRGSTARP